MNSFTGDINDVRRYFNLNKHLVQYLGAYSLTHVFKDEETGALYNIPEIELSDFEITPAENPNPQAADEPVAPTKRTRKSA